MPKLKGSLTAAAVTLALSTAGTLQAADLADAIEYRQSAFSVMAWHFGPMGEMAQGNIDYDAEEFARRADNIAALSSMPWEGFIEGSYQGGNHGIDTDAMAGIADNMDDIQDRIAVFMEEAGNLAEVAQNGDFAQSRQAFAAVANSCRSCHDDYRDN